MKISLPCFLLIASLLVPNLTSAGSASDDGTWSSMFPQVPYGRVAVYDAPRDRMLVIGSTVMGLPLAGTPTWTELNATGTTPEAQTAIYDPVRDRVVTLSSDSEVWALSLTGTPSWTQVTPTGTPPPPSYRPVAIYDPVRDRMMFFAMLGGVWELSLSGEPTWTELAPVGPLPSDLWYFSVVYDPVRNNAVLLGGEDGAPNDQVWSLSLSGSPTWTELVPNGTLPPFRSRHTAIYDPLYDRMVVFGGDDWNGRPHHDVWALNLSGSLEWTELLPEGRTPQNRSAHAAFYDPIRARMVIYGGVNDTPRTDDHWNDTWALPLTGELAWTAIEAQPSPRSGHTAIYDPLRDRMVVFSGLPDHHLGDPRDDLPSLSLSGSPKWTVLNAGPSPEMWQGHSAIYDPSGDRMVVFGGWSNEVWQLSLSGTPVWAPLTPSGTPPSGSSGHTAIYDALRDRMLVLDGTGVFALSLSGSAVWSELSASGTGPAGGEAPIYDPVRDRMLVFVGTRVWALSLSGSPVWAEFTPSGTPPTERNRYTTIYDPVRDRVVIFAGRESLEGFNDVWALSLMGTPAWTQLTPVGDAPNLRHGHTAIYDPRRDRMVIFGGVFGFYYEDRFDTWALEWGHPLDATPPQITVNLNHDVLWPANHKLVNVCATVRLVDSVDPAPTFKLTSITAVDGKHAIDAAVDIKNASVGTADLCYDLRAVRSGNGDGRVYQIVYQASDASNNVAYDTVSVQVPAKAPHLTDDATHVTVLSSVHPNPFNPETTVDYSLESPQRVVITIYDVRGSLVRRLVEETKPAGEYRATWNGVDNAGRPASSGIYLLRMSAGSYAETRKLVMLK